MSEAGRRDAALLLRRLTTHVQAQLVQGCAKHLWLGKVSKRLEAPLRVEVVGDAGPHLREEGGGSDRGHVMAG